MRALLLTVAIAVSSPLTAEPVKPLVAASSSQQHPATLTLASNDTVRSGSDDSARHGQPPVPHRIARVTTCRCGDPQPDPEPSSEQQ